MRELGRGGGGIVGLVRSKFDDMEGDARAEGEAIIRRNDAGASVMYGGAMYKINGVKE